MIICIICNDVMFKYKYLKITYVFKFWYLWLSTGMAGLLYLWSADDTTLLVENQYSAVHSLASRNVWLWSISINILKVLISHKLH